MKLSPPSPFPCLHPQIIHKVKALLESGVFLNRSMLHSVVDHIAKFTSGTGLQRYNKYSLSIFTFIAKCVGVPDAELDDLFVELDVCMVVYGTVLPPSRMSAAGAGPGAGAALGAGAGAEGVRVRPGGQSPLKSPIGSRLKLANGGGGAGGKEQQEGGGGAGGGGGGDAPMEAIGEEGEEAAAAAAGADGETSQAGGLPEAGEASASPS